MALKVLCVVPTLGKNLDLLNRCLLSARRSLPPNSKIEVVWNSLVTPPQLRSDVSVYWPGVNLGYGPAINVAVRRNPSKLIWMLQDDMDIPEPYVDKFCNVLGSDPSIAVITPAIAEKAPEGHPSPRGGRITEKGLLVDFEDLVALPSDGSVSVEIKEMGWVVLSGALVRHSAFLEVGGFDLGYFPVGHSDVDLCWRLRQAGYKVAAGISHGVVHHKAQSTPGLLGSFAFRRHQEYFESKVNGNLPSQAVIDVPSEILPRIAQLAASKIVDFATFAQEELGRTQEELGRTQEELGRTQEELGRTQEELKKFRVISSFLVYKLKRLANRLHRTYRRFVKRPRETDL